MNQLPAQRRTIDRRIIGTPEHVRQTVKLATASGRLVHVSPWTETPEGVQVTVRLLDRAPATPPAPRRRRFRGTVVVATATLLTGVGVAGYALVQVVNAVVAVFPYIVGGLLLLALVALITGRRSRTFSGTFTGRMH